MLANKALQKYENPATKPREIKLEELSFYDAFDLDATLRYSYPEAKAAYHHRLKVATFQMRWAYRREPQVLGELKKAHTKGEIGGKLDKVVCGLISLVFKEMERMRTDDPERYAIYLRRGRFFAETNRQQLCTMVREHFRESCSPNTVSNALTRAREVGLIIDTHHTSRTIREVTDERGRKTKIVTMKQRGRGNFRLFIDPALLVPKAHFCEGNQKSQNTENQPFGSIKNQNLVQSKDISFDTLKKEKKNGGTVENTDSPVGEAVENGPPPIGSGDESGNERGMSHIRHISKKIREKIPPVRHLSEEDAAAEIGKWKQAGGRRGEKHRARLRRDEQVRNALPEKDLGRFAAYCWLLCRELLWPHFDEKYLRSITPYAAPLLKLHFHRLDRPMEEAYQIVSYAIQRQAEQLAKGGYCYAPMHFLNPDLEYTGGTLRHVIDHWLLDGEFRRLAERNLQYEKQVKWCYAYGHSHKVFRLFTRDLEAHGYSFVSSRLLSGYYDGLLQKYFDRNGIGEKAQATIRRKFADRASGLVMGLGKLGGGERLGMRVIAFGGWDKARRKRNGK